MERSGWRSSSRVAASRSRSSSSSAARRAPHVRRYGIVIAGAATAACGLDNTRVPGLIAPRDVLPTSRRSTAAREPPIRSRSDHGPPPHLPTSTAPERGHDARGWANVVLVAASSASARSRWPAGRRSSAAPRSSRGGVPPCCGALLLSALDAPSPALLGLSRWPAPWPPRACRSLRSSSASPRLRRRPRVLAEVNSLAIVGPHPTRGGRSTASRTRSHAPARPGAARGRAARAGGSRGRGVLTLVVWMEQDGRRRRRRARPRSGFLVLAAPEGAQALDREARARRGRCGRGGSRALAVDALTSGSSHVTRALGGPVDLAGELALGRGSVEGATSSWHAVLLVVVGRRGARVAGDRSRAGPCSTRPSRARRVLVVNDTRRTSRVRRALVRRSLRFTDGRTGDVDSRSDERLAILSALALSRRCGGARPPRRSRDDGSENTATTQDAAAAEGAPRTAKQIFASAGCGSCHTLEDAGTSGTIGRTLDESQPDLQLASTASRTARGTMRPSRQAQRAGVATCRPTSVEAAAASLPPTSGRVEALACDLDRTLIAEDAVLRPRTRDALVAGRAPPGPRRDRDRPHVPRRAAVWRPAGLEERSSAPGRGGGRPEERALPPSHPDRARRRARGAAASPRGLPPELLRGRRAYVAEVTPEATPSGLAAIGSTRWAISCLARRPPTKLVSVWASRALDGLESRLKARFDGRLYVSKSLPFFLELASRR